MWAFQQLGARPGDELVDLYPGSGAVSEAWQRYTAMPSSTSDTPPAAAAAGDARADDDRSRTPAGGQVLSDPSRPGDENRADLTLFDDAGPGDGSSETSERSAA